jgi:hypothetical protein
MEQKARRQIDRLVISSFVILPRFLFGIVANSSHNVIPRTRASLVGDSHCDVGPQFTSRTVSRHPALSDATFHIAFGRSMCVRLNFSPKCACEALGFNHREASASFLVII